MSNKLGWWGIALGLAIAHCGGKSVAEVASDAAASGGSGVSIAGSAGAANMAECDDAGPSDGGCGGEAGADPSQPYAGLRTGCAQNASANRRGAPVPICFHIH